MSFSLHDTQQQAAEIEDDLEKLQRLVEEVKDKQTELLSTFGRNEKLTKAVDRKVYETKEFITKVRKKLIAFEHTVEKIELESGSSVHYRIRKNQFVSFSNRLVDILQYYNESQVSFSGACKNLIQKQLQVVGKPTDQEELESLLESGNTAVFTENVIAETREAKQALQEINERHSQLLKVEKSIREIHELFLHISILVEEQGHKVDTIESHVTKTVDFVEQSNKELQSAIIKKRQSRKLRLILIIIGLVVLAVIIILIALQFS